jgi:inorganic phosphate transporter, PiT family
MILIGTSVLLVVVIAAGLVFALSNGLHDASSVVATFISSGAASPRQAILLASVFGLVGAVFGGNAVADTISRVVDLPASPFLLPILLAAILGAVLWNLLTWKLGLPSSSTHALVGGIIGAVTVSSGFQHILWGWHELASRSHQLTGITMVVAALVFSPVLGFATAFILEKAAKILLRNAAFGLNKWLNRLQWVIAAALSYSHGANDTQKVIGILALAIMASGRSSIQEAPLWVRIAGGLVMFFGTLLGGWSIMKTIGRGIYDIQPVHSVNSQLASVGSILLATAAGAPISTTHVVVGSVMGVGAADQYKIVRWQIVKQIIMAWFVTIPAAAIVAAGVFLIFGWLLRMV